MYKVFISYRRDGGFALARLFYERLDKLGFHPFLDVEELRSGPFNDKLYTVIEECDDFIVILPPNGLDRCVNKNDWVRLEVEHAIKSGKNIIPVMINGFLWPSKLPQSLKKLPYFNGVPASQEYFDASVEKLCSMLTSSNSDSVPADGKEFSIDVRSVRCFTDIGLESTVFKIKKDKNSNSIIADLNFERTRLRDEIPTYAGLYYLFQSDKDLTKYHKLLFKACSPDGGVDFLTVELKPKGRQWMHETFEFELSESPAEFCIDFSEFDFPDTRKCLEEITFVFFRTSFAHEDKLTGSIEISEIAIC